MQQQSIERAKFDTSNTHMHDRDRNTHMHDRAMSLSVYRHFNKKLPGEEESEDTKGTTRIRKSKKDRQHNG